MSMSDVVESPPDGAPPPVRIVWWARAGVWAVELVMVIVVAFLVLHGTAANAAGSCGGG